MSVSEHIRFRSVSKSWAFCIGGILYFLLVLFSLYLAKHPAAIVTVWLPGGIAIAAIVRSSLGAQRWRILAAVYCIDLVAALAFGDGIAKSLCLATGNTLEVALASLIILFFERDNNFLNGIPGLISEVIPAMFIAPLAGAAIGSLNMCHLGMPEFYNCWMHWYTAHAVGIFAVLPLGLIVTKERCAELWTRRVAIQFAGMFVFFVAITAIARAHFFPPVLFLNLALVIAALLFPIVGSFFLNLLTIFAINVFTTTGIILQMYAFQPGFDPARYLGIILTIIPAILVATLTEAIRRDRQELLQATNRAKSSEHAKTMFLAAMSHEIRSPLNSIIGFANLLWDADTTKKNRELTAPILTGGEVLLSLINDILDYSKIEAGRIDLENISFSPSECVRQVKELFVQKAREKGISLHAEIDGNVPPMVVGDETRLRQVLINLVANALKFTPEGKVEIKLTSTSVKEGLHALYFCVCDTGIGIPSEKLNQIFERFEQADSSIARQFGGTGLGLAISKHLTEAMGGRLWVESEIGKGSVFHMLVSLREPSGGSTIDPANRHVDQEEKNHMPVLPEKVAKLQILVVDDNESNSKLVTLLLKRMGCKNISSVKDGQAAVEKCRTEKFDVVLMDCQMPILDGFEATRQIRQIERSEPRSHRIEVIALTAAVFNEDRRRAVDVGMDDFLSKPIRQHTLALALEKACARLISRD